ncbi:MAG: ABC transporter ATP-binding protein [Actinomycetota bacterium]
MSRVSGEVAGVRGLVKEYRSFRSRTRGLNGIDLDIREGEAVGLLGPNGAGKTTFVKCLLGLLRPSDGSVTLFGRSPHESEARRLAGFAPETPQFPPFLSAPEVMAFHGRLLQIQPAEAQVQSADLLRQAGLENAPRRVKAFSKGMIRRLAVAQALIGRPRLLVLDEPTADLDPIGRREIRNQLNELKDSGVTILLNSHLLSEVERICDRVAILHQGKVLASGTLEELVPEGKDLESVFVDLVTGAGSS